MNRFYAIKQLKNPNQPPIMVETNDSDSSPAVYQFNLLTQIVTYLNLIIL